MPKLQELPDGHFIITLPKDIVVGKNWKKGSDIGFAIVDEINRPLAGDIFLRMNR